MEQDPIGQYIDPSGNLIFYAKLHLDDVLEINN